MNTTFVLSSYPCGRFPQKKVIAKSANRVWNGRLTPSVRGDIDLQAGEAQKLSSNQGGRSESTWNTGESTWNTVVDDLYRYTLEVQRPSNIWSFRRDYCFSKGL